MVVYAVFMNDYDDRLKTYHNILVGLYKSKKKADEIISTIPSTANPRWSIYKVE